MWNRLQSRIGGRGIVVLVVALVAVVVGAALLLGSGDEETTAEPQAAVTGDATTEPSAPAKQDGGDTEKNRPSGPDDEAATQAPSGVPEEFADFRDCVRDHGGIPIDLDDLPENTGGSESEPEGEDIPAALEDYTPQEIENLREARAACIDGLPGETQNRAEQIADSPFRSCVAAEQELGKDLVDAVLACEGELPEGSELPPNFGESERPFGPGGPQDGEGPPGD